MTTDTYSTIGSPSRAEIKVRGSRFLAFAFPVRSREEALGRWKELQAEFYDATHHCVAWRLGPAGEDFRTVDDGEPSGSAGRPILQTIDRLGLTDVAVVVVRYFGGTKLGVGGLARAYGEAAGAALAATPAETRQVTAYLWIAFSHNLTPGVMRAAGAMEAAIVGTRYDDDAHLRLAVRQSRLESLRAALVEATHGGVRFDTETPESGPAGPGSPA